MISHCGQLVLVSGESQSQLSCQFPRARNKICFPLVSEKKKEKKRKVSTGGESESSSSSKNEKKKKKKKKSKHKKKEKHHSKERSTDKAEKVHVEQENQSQTIVHEEKRAEKEISAREIIGLKTTIDPDEIPEIPQHKFLMRKVDNDTDNQKTEAVEQQ